MSQHITDTTQLKCDKGHINLNTRKGRKRVKFYS